MTKFSGRTVAVVAGVFVALCMGAWLLAALAPPAGSRAFDYQGKRFWIPPDAGGFTEQEAAELRILLSAVIPPAEFEQRKSLVAFHSALEIPGQASSAGQFGNEGEIQFTYFGVCAPGGEGRVFVYANPSLQGGAFRLVDTFSLDEISTNGLAFQVGADGIVCRGRWGKGDILWQNPLPEA